MKVVPMNRRTGMSDFTTDKMTYKCREYFIRDMAVAIAPVSPHALNTENDLRIFVMLSMKGYIREGRDNRFYLCPPYPPYSWERK